MEGRLQGGDSPSSSSYLNRKRLSRFKDATRSIVFENRLDLLAQLVDKATEEEKDSGKDGFISEHSFFELLAQNGIVPESDKERDAVSKQYTDYKGRTNFKKFFLELEVAQPSEYVDPELMADRLPQPYRMIVKVMEEDVIDTAWDMIVAKFPDARDHPLQQGLANWKPVAMTRSCLGKNLYATDFKPDYISQSSSGSLIAFASSRGKLGVILEDLSRKELCSEDDSDIPFNQIAAERVKGSSCLHIATVRNEGKLDLTTQDDPETDFKENESSAVITVYRACTEDESMKLEKLSNAINVEDDHVSGVWWSEDGAILALGMAKQQSVRIYKVATSSQPEQVENNNPIGLHQESPPTTIQLIHICKLDEKSAHSRIPYFRFLGTDSAVMGFIDGVQLGLFSFHEETKTKKWYLPKEAHVFDLCKEERLLSIGLNDGTVLVWNLHATNNIRAYLRHTMSPVSCLHIRSIDQLPTQIHETDNKPHSPVGSAMSRNSHGSSQAASSLPSKGHSARFEILCGHVDGSINAFSLYETDAEDPGSCGSLLFQLREPNTLQSLEPIQLVSIQGAPLVIAVFKDSSEREPRFSLVVYDLGLKYSIGRLVLAPNENQEEAVDWRCSQLKCHVQGESVFVSAPCIFVQFELAQMAYDFYACIQATCERQSKQGPIASENSALGIQRLILNNRASGNDPRKDLAKLLLGKSSPEERSNPRAKLDHLFKAKTEESTFKRQTPLRNAPSPAHSSSRQDTTHGQARVKSPSRQSRNLSSSLSGFAGLALTKRMTRRKSRLRELKLMENATSMKLGNIFNTSSPIDPANKAMMYENRRQITRKAREEQVTKRLEALARSAKGS